MVSAQRGGIIITITEYLKKQGYTTIDESFYSYIAIWESWYKGDVKSFHRYKIYNGDEHISCKRDTLDMGKKVCEDWADLLMNERVKIVLGGENGAETEQDFWAAVINENQFWIRINEMQERKAALGTVAYIPYATDISVNSKTGQLLPNNGQGKIKINYILAPNIHPLSWENGEITECAFSSEKTVEGKNYLFLQLHLREKEGLEYIIQNRIFENHYGSLREVELQAVKGFEQVVSEIHTHSPEKQFVIDRLNIANNIDLSNPMGVAVFANALDVLRGIDLVYDSYNNEFVLGKKRIMVSEEGMRKQMGGEMVYDPNDLVFYKLPGDMRDNKLIEPIDMSLRAQEHELALQNRLTTLSMKCGFGDKQYKFEQGSVATARQIISENSALFRTLKKHEIILEKALKSLVRIVLRIGRDVLGQALNPDVEITIDFDDSIIEDKQAEFERDARYLQMGIMRAEEFRAKYMNEDIDTARRNLPEMTQLVSEDGY